MTNESSTPSHLEPPPDAVTAVDTAAAPEGFLVVPSWILRAAAAGLLLAVVFFVWRGYGPHILDDAYITFRYARNLAEGEGVVYNPGERVQGSSTPLFTLILGGLGSLGIPIPAAGVVLSVLAGLATLTLLTIAGYRLDAETAGWVAAVALSTQFFWVLLFVSGMETTLYSALILGLLLAVGERRWRCTGVLIGLVCMVRYDGALAGLAALVILLWKGGWKTVLRQGLIAAAVYLPWMIFSWAWFGNPIPQSVRAKQIINLIDWNTLWSHYDLFIDYSPLLWLWLAFFAVGMATASSRRPAWGVFPLWVVLYLGAFILEKRPIMYYPWYIVPLLPVVVFFGAYEAWEITRAVLRRHPLWAPAAFLFVSTVVVLFQAADLRERQGEYGADALHRERKYRQAARILAPRILPGDTLYVGEIGTLGWFLPDARILDSAGLLTPEVYRIRLRDREALEREGKKPEDYPDGSADVTRMVIHELRPDFITTARNFLWIQEIQDEAFFRELYEPLASNRLRPLDQVAFRRRMLTGQR